MSCLLSEQSSIQLVAKNPKGATRIFDLAIDQGVFVGQSSNCGLQLNGEGIGDIHCRVWFEEGKLLVQDWMSSTGTRVNGSAIDSATELKSEDVIEIGDQRISMGVGKQNKPAAKPVNEEPAEAESPPTSKVAVDEASPAESDFEPEFDSMPSFEGGLLGPESTDFDADFLAFEEEETFDRETVELLRAEIETLQSALAEKESEHLLTSGHSDCAPDSHDAHNVDDIEKRIQELIEEANRSDERAAMLEEMLHAAEDSSRSELEERNQLEAWVGDIETRIGQREQEHAAELDALRHRLEEAQNEQDQLRRRLGQAAHGGNAPKQYEETLEKLQRANHDLQEKLAESEKQRNALQQQLDEASGHHDRAMREERAKMAKEQARIARLRFELSEKLKDVEELPKEENAEDKEASQRLSALRQHLREIHEQEKKEEAEASITTRLAKLWKRVEY